MSKNSQPSEFMNVLDYILNRCTIREIDAVDEAVKRRRRDLGASTGMTGLDPGYIAKSMTETVQESIDKSMKGMQESFRGFARSLILKETPDMPEDQIEYLTDKLIPDMQGLKKKNTDSRSPSAPAGTDSGKSLVARTVNGIPVEAMHDMVLQFVRYSNNSMPVENIAALRDSIGDDWPESYWKVFPEEIRSLVKTHLEDGLDAESFYMTLIMLLS